MSSLDNYNPTYMPMPQWWVHLPSYVTQAFPSPQTNDLVICDWRNDMRITIPREEVSEFARWILQTYGDK